MTTQVRTRVGHNHQLVLVLDDEDVVVFVLRIPGVVNVLLELDVFRKFVIEIGHFPARLAVGTRWRCDVGD